MTIGLRYCYWYWANLLRNEGVPAREALREGIEIARVLRGAIGA